MVGISRLTHWRALLGTLAFLALGTVAVEARACIAEAPPHWPTVLKPDGPAVFVGRVIRTELDERPVKLGVFQVTQASATIRSLERVQGPSVQVARVIGAISAKPLVAEPPTFCGDRLKLQAGDLVIGLRRPDGSVRAILPQDVWNPDLLARIEKHR